MDPVELTLEEFEGELVDTFQAVGFLAAVEEGVEFLVVATEGMIADFDQRQGTGGDIRGVAMKHEGVWVVVLEDVLGS